MSEAPAIAVPAEAGARTAEADEGWRRTSPASILATGGMGVLQSLLPMAAVLVGSGMRNWGIAIAGLVMAGIVALNFLVAALAWWRTQYRIGSSDVRVEKGFVSRQARSVPFERIQDVSLEEKLLPRLLGLVEVRFETGAGGGEELKLAFVSRSEGEALRQAVRARLEGGGALEQDVAADDVAHLATAAAPLFAMGPRRLLIFGLFEFSLVVFAVLGGAAQQFEFLLPFDPWDVEGWQARFAGSNAAIIAWLGGIGWAAQLVGVLLALAVLALIGLATGIARTLAREWGFRLERTSKGFRRRRGLFTRTDVVMPVHRVQALKLTTGMLRRIWGWHGLSFISLAGDAGSANHSVAPFARLPELAPIAREAGFALPGEATQWRRPSRRFRTDWAIVSAVIPLTIALLLALFGAPLQAGAAVLVAIVLSGRQLLLRRFERYRVEPDQILARTGALAPRTIVAVRAKLHSVELERNPLARLRNYASLRFGLAGGRLRIDGVPLAEAQAIRAAVLSSIAEVDFSALPR